MLTTMPSPTLPMDTTLRAVELAVTIGSVKRLSDGSASLYLKSNLEFSKAEHWPLSLLQGEQATALITPEHIGEDADQAPAKPKGKSGGSASQIQRLLIEQIGRANGVTTEGLENYYQRRMEANRSRLEQELARAANKEF